MGIKARKGSANELGNYLPDGEAELTLTSEEIAAEYGGIEPKVEKDSIGVNTWDCKFKLWG